MKHWLLISTKSLPLTFQPKLLIMDCHQDIETYDLKITRTPEVEFHISYPLFLDKLKVNVNL